MEYTFYMIWVMTFESEERWHMGRFDIDTDEDEAFGIAQSSLRGGVGGDACEILRIEYGYDDGIYTDYVSD